ncbi:MAG: hypothetical protein IPP71_23005 [Bacteroidetes bacterium]|nr:hypothetical protein [Bacteroidota bacterium]
MTSFSSVIKFNFQEGAASTSHYYSDINECRVDVFDSITDVPLDKWENCIEMDDLFLSKKYLSVVERSALPGMKVRYVILSYDDSVKAILYFQVINLSDAGLGGILNLEEYGGLAATISTRINDLLFSPSGEKSSFLLVCGNLLLSGDHGIRAVDDEAYSKAVQCISGIKKLINESLGNNARIVAYMVKDFYEKEDKLAGPALKKDYFLLNTDPEMIFEIRPQWSNFEDYLSSLSSKYRLRANNVKAKLGNVIIRDLSLEEIIDAESALFSFNEQVIRKAPVKLVKPSSAYFVNLKRTFGDNYNIKAFILNNEIIAFTSALWNKKHFEAHYIGIDYSLNSEYSLYQNILYSYINDAITCKSKQLFFGRTALEIKSTTGAKPHTLSCYFRFANRVISTLAKPLVSSTGPRSWIPRDPFKN